MVQNEVSIRRYVYTNKREDVIDVIYTLCKENRIECNILDSYNDKIDCIFCKEVVSYKGYSKTKLTEGENILERNEYHQEVIENFISLVDDVFSNYELGDCIWSRLEGDENE